MKLRRIPEDFQVTELSTIIPGSGPFALYRLKKTSIGTPEAISAVTEKWQIHRKRISYGGLKDRHAVTVQYLTIHNGPRKSLRQKSIELEYLGQTTSAFTSAEMLGNRFCLVLRDMTDQELARAVAALESIRHAGLPNYFDDQRFGCLGVSGEWIARAWCLGEWERALWLALADPHEHDSADEKQQKKILRDLWGNWPECQQQLARSSRRSIVTYLSDKVKVGRPADYRGALARISVDLRGLYLSAWQSALWNRLLSKYLGRVLGASAVEPVSLISGPALFPVTTGEDQAAAFHSTQLPLPCARIDHPEGIIGELLSEVLAEEQIELRQIRVKYPRDSFFSKGTRAAMIPVGDLTMASAPDDMYAGSQKLTLAFDLPRGSYATILVKRITTVASGGSGP